MKNNLNTKYQLANVFYFATFASMLAFASNYMLDLGFSNSTIGIVMALYSIISVFLQPALADFSDRHPKLPIRNLITVLLLVMIVISLLLYVAGITLKNNFIVLVLIIGVFSLLNSTMPLFNTLAFIYEKFGVTINYGVARGLGSAAYAVVSMGLGYVIEWTSPSVLPLFYVLFMIGAFLVVRTYRLPGAKAQRIEHEDKQEGEKLSIMAFAMKYRMFILLLCGFCLIYADHMLINNFYIQIVNECGGNASSMGIIVFIAAILELPAMFGFDWLNKKFGVANLIRISMVFTFIKHLLTWMASSMWMLYLASVIQGVAYAVYIPAMVYLVNEVVSSNDVLMGQSINTTFMTLGGVIGSLVGGVLMDFLGVKGSLFTGVILTGLGVVIVFMALGLLKLHKPEQAS